MGRVLLLLAVAVAMAAGQNVPAGIPPSFDCSMRKATLGFAQRLLPQYGSFAEAFDALELSTRCNMTRPTAGQTPRATSSAAIADVPAWYVDSVRGDDERGTGGVASPLRTIQEGVRRAGMGGSHRQVVVRGGVYREVVVIKGVANLTVRSYPGEEVWVSGAVPVRNISWEKVREEGGVAVYRAVIPSEAAGLNKGMRVNGRRAVRARYPNGDPETMGMHTTPSGWFPSAGEWLAPRTPASDPVIVKVEAANRTEDTSIFRFYQIGIGGPCNGFFTPNVSFWCNPNNPRDGRGGLYRVPSGVRLNGTAIASRPSTWKSWRGGVVHAWHLNHWASWMYEMAEVDGDTVRFGIGGFQDGRGNSQGKELYFENLLEELDAANEWYLDGDTLYYAVNSTEAPPREVELTNRTTLLRVLSSHNVSIIGMGFRDTAYTYLDPHSVPSGGDWALQRAAAVYIEGQVHSTVANCTFERLDGNALMLSGFNRNVTIAHNEFAWIGDTAMAAWGVTDELRDNGTKGYDATSGDFPWGTRVVGNLVREVGIWEKQSSAWFQAKTAETTIEGNVFFNGPRAGINFNDNLGGGSAIRRNVLFNFCRESGDHGPFNSWDRQIFLTLVRGYASTIPKWNTIENNLFIANYNSQEGFDTDDGSSYYHVRSNVFVYGHNGLKSDLGGHDNQHVHNLYLYLSPTCMFTQQHILPGHEDVFANNTCVLASPQRSYAAYNCKDTLPVIGNNTVFVPSSTPLEECGVPLTQYQAQGFDLGTVVLPHLPSDASSVDMMHSFLGF
eukprot:Sspe_Gene.41907::Locus_20289_Transcript_1_1_Confidence_1.000_Length_2420::g.41907::m.41907